MTNKEKAFFEVIGFFQSCVSIIYGNSAVDHIALQHMRARKFNDHKSCTIQNCKGAAVIEFETFCLDGTIDVQFPCSTHFHALTLNGLKSMLKCDHSKKEKTVIN